ncbi:enoyl-CoA hydratase/isomerase family protein [Fusibacter paucivorans]|uniref:Enoyl-CoA hydratase/isomerase family protein n=1 Tax=Fusibacter paucivorans TaxID=76009 RepID=A0ABS5PS17_9FIRM|nr:enoyl-CoA hydratase/isomerase family protein [Fusibacter paucivorans]MBS7526862.1 enoyl-CoA hydratase/isomerase family protein [Fusibacter paucivorans]
MNHSEYQHIVLEVRNRIAWVTLNRPNDANAFDLALSKELLYALLDCDASEEVLAVIITGNGKMFSAGGDLKAFMGSEQGASYCLKEVTVYLHSAIAKMVRMAKPVIIAVNGVAAGAGMSLACAGDFIIASEKAKFTMAYTKAGLTPDAASTYFLPRIVGMNRAIELATTNRVLTAQEALEWGIAYQVVPADQLMEKAEALAAALTSGSVQAFGAVKKLMHIGWTSTLETQMENEAAMIANISTTADGQEGMQAFLEKRSPVFNR